MLEHLKKVLLQSFVAPIALGLLLAQAVAHLANSVVLPFSDWFLPRGYTGLPNHPIAPSFSLLNGAPELLRAVLGLLLWYFLLYWLYLKPEEPAHQVEPSLEPSE